MVKITSSSPPDVSAVNAPNNLAASVGGDFKAVTVDQQKPVAPLPASEPASFAAELGEKVRTGQLTLAAAQDILVNQVVGNRLNLLTPEQRTQLTALLREYLASDPYLKMI